MTTFPRTAQGVLASLVILLVPALSAPDRRESLPTPRPTHNLPAGPATPVPAIECPDCSDDNACTVDSCDTTTGFCRHEPLNCDDGDPCTAEFCNRFEPSPGCTHRAMGDGEACTEEVPCVRAGVCASGVCLAGVPKPAGTSCETVIDCSEEGATCDGAGHCNAGRLKPIGASCNDLEFCTIGDTCQADGTGAVTCQGGTSLPCDDFDPCTIDSCGADEECVHDPVSCSDGNPCTTDTCDSLTGVCSHTAGTDNPYCAGPDFCTYGACVAGNCTGSNGAVCPDPGECGHGVCIRSNNALVLCVFRGEDARCDRTSCEAAFCDQQTFACRGAGACHPTPCSQGTCDTQFQCLDVVPTSGGVCSDGNACTVDDVCANGVCQGTGASCDDANSCTTDRCDGGLCGHDTIAPHPISCGVGACTRTVDTCAGGIPVACVPGAPQPETCNGVDDDCDGLVDENRIMANCMIKPALLFDPGMRTTFAMTCRFRDRCAGNADLPPAGVDAGPVYVTRADRLADPNDNVVAPDPQSLVCPDPQQGTSFERGIVESAAARVLGGSTATFNFTLPHDGECATLDGDRTALLGRMQGTPDGLVTICVSGGYAGSPWEGCALAFLRHAPGSAD